MNYAAQIAQTGNLLRSARPRPKKGLKKSRIKRVSKKREGELAIYRKMLPGWLRAHPRCEIGPIFHAAGIHVNCMGRTSHPHHIRGRIGKLLYQEDNLLASCSGECHPQAVHQTHKDAAITLGIIK
jgi:hypothetical protein